MQNSVYMPPAHQIKLELVPVKVDTTCIACNGSGGFNSLTEYHDCLLCGATGEDDHLLTGIMSGEIVPPVFEKELSLV